jgi:hypothetical protein
LQSARLEIQRLERLASDQRQRIVQMEEADDMAGREVNEHSMRTIDIADALYPSLHERAALLHFLVDLLTTLQSLFYEPTAFNSMGLLRPVPALCKAEALAVDRGERMRSRAWSAERVHTNRHMHSGCYACHPRANNSPSHAKSAGCLAPRCDGASDLRELVVALEGEISVASQEYSMQVQRLVMEAERCARILGVHHGSDLALASAAGASTSEAVALAAGPRERGVLRTCLDWIEEERRMREKLSVTKDRLMPAIDWIDERAQYHAVTRAMETKFNQLAKLKRALQLRQVSGGESRGGRKPSWGHY